MSALNPVLLDTDGSLQEQAELCRRIDKKIDLRDMERRIRLAAMPWTFARLRERLRAEIQPPCLAFLGSGDFHHLALLLLERAADAAREPVHLVMIDNHPDWMRLPPRSHCGNWVSAALKLPGVATVTLIGQGPGDLTPWKMLAAPRRALRSDRLMIHPFTGPMAVAFAQTADRIAAKAVYLSIDKDCLRAADAASDWDPGGMALDDLVGGVREITSKCRIIGADICGDRAATPLRGLFRRLDAGRLFRQSPPLTPRDTEVNQRANLALLDVLLGAAGS